MIGNLSQQSGSFRSGFVLMIGCWTIASVLVLLCPRERTAPVHSVADTAAPQ
jgi:hypothetical protein